MNPTLLQVSESIELQRQAIVADTVSLEFTRHPELERRYATVAREKSQQDAEYHLSFLAAALAADNAAFFVDYAGWTKIVLASRGVLSDDLAFHLHCMTAALRKHLPAELSSLASEYIDTALRALPGLPEDVPSLMDDRLPLAPLANEYLQTLLRGDRHVASELILNAVGQGTPVKEIYLHVFQRTQFEIGRLWQTNRISVAKEHYCSAVTQLIMSMLYPRIFSDAKHGNTLVATCISGNLHEISARMVADFFEMDGWDTCYLGANTPAAGILDAIREFKPDILAVSASLLQHVKAVQALIATIRANSDLASLKIIVGGHPFNIDTGLWKKVGADGFAPDAQQAIAFASEFTAGASAL